MDLTVTKEIEKMGIKYTYKFLHDYSDAPQKVLWEYDSGFRNVVVVEKLPVVPREKFENLESVIRRIFSQIFVIKEDGLYMPVDPETEKTLGSCFIMFDTPEEAQTVRERMHRFKLDRCHTLSVSMFDYFYRFPKVPGKWAPPEIRPYVPLEEVKHWLIHPKGREQFVIRAGSITEIMWNDARQMKPDPVYMRPFWTKDFVQWSPLGTFLATIHGMGVAIWGGATEFSRLRRFVHQRVELIDFSPGEKYLVTCCIFEGRDDTDEKMVDIKIFDIRTGKVMSNFWKSADDFLIRGTGGVTLSWPIFRWGGGEDRYFARIEKDGMSVFETAPSQVDNELLKVENVMDFSWSPTDPILALFVPELGVGNWPAKVSLVQIPSMEEIRQKNLFSVSDCKMFWQSNGDFLAVKVDHYAQTKRSTDTGFEFFRIKEPDIPIEFLELENKEDNVVAFAWEPKGHRFAVIHGDNQWPDISFYSMRTATNNNRITKLVTLKRKQANALFWSPAGRFIVLAGLKRLNGQLEFYNVDDLETMATSEHFMATDIQWDPTGRYVATSVTSGHEMGNGFCIWSFNGTFLYGIRKDNLFQFLWRPRPPPLLSVEKEEEIVKNLNSNKYEAERERRRMLSIEFEKWLNKRNKLERGRQKQN